MSRRKDTSRNKKPNIMDSGVEEFKEDDNDEISLTSRESANLEQLIPSDANLDQLIESIVEKVRACSGGTGESNSLQLDPIDHENSGLPPFSDLAQDGEFNESVNHWFRKKDESGVATENTALANNPVASLPEHPQSRTELEQLFLDVFTQQIQGNTMNNSRFLEELRRLLPSVARTHVNALIVHMLDWIERQKRNDIQNDPVIAPMVENGSLIKVQSSDPTVHSGGVRVGRGPYKCNFCGKLKKLCHCKLHDDGSGEVEDVKKRKFSIRPIEDVDKKTQASIKRGLIFLKTIPLEDCSGSESDGSREGYLCNLCGHPKLPKEEHKNRCVLGPGECFKMGKDGKTVFKVTEISSEKGVKKRTREEASSGGEDGGVSENRCDTSNGEDDDRKPAAVQLSRRSGREVGDLNDGNNVGKPDGSGSDEETSGDGAEFDGIERHAV